MTQTSTAAVTDTDIANLDALTNLDERIATVRRRLSAGRSGTKLTNERLEILASLQAERSGLCALLPLEILAAYVRTTHDKLMDHKGAGKATLIARRLDALREYRSALIGRAFLTEDAIDSDVLELAQGATTVAKVNARYAELMAEAKAEDSDDFPAVGPWGCDDDEVVDTEDAAQETGISDFAKAQIGTMVNAMITEADDRDKHIEPTRAALNAHRDAMRDLRDELVRLGLMER